MFLQAKKKKKKKINDRLHTERTSTSVLENPFTFFSFSNAEIRHVAFACFAGTAQTWAYFYGPVGVLLTLNMIYLGLTSWHLWHQYRDYTGSKLRVLRFKCLLYIKLVLVMGITWIFELMSFAIDTKIDEFW